MLPTRDSTVGTLFTKAATLTIYGKFKTSLLEISLKFVLGSLSSNVLVTCITLWSNFSYDKSA